MGTDIAIGVIGDFQPNLLVHRATNQALQHAADALALQLSVRWLPTPSLLSSDSAGTLAEHHGLFASPGSPYACMDGALAGIAFARRRDWPFVGT